MGTPIFIICGNIIALFLAILLHYNVTEVYSFLAFNMVLFLFIGFVNLLALIRTNIIEKKDE